MITRRNHHRVRDHSDTLPSHDRWLLSYADFVTLLLAMFIVLFAITWRSHQSINTVSSAIHSGFDALSLNPPEHPDTAVQRTQPHSSLDPVAAQLQAVLGDSIRKREIVLQETPEGLVISLRELGFFQSGDATLVPGAMDKLKLTATVLIKQGLHVRVEGHSDDQPIHNTTFQSNWELSTARAMSVLSVLMDGGFPPANISVAGYGPYRPIAENRTSDGRRQNRRVDLVVLKPTLPQ